MKGSLYLCLKKPLSMCHGTLPPLYSYRSDEFVSLGTKLEEVYLVNVKHYCSLWHFPSHTAFVCTFSIINQGQLSFVCISSLQSLQTQLQIFQTCTRNSNHFLQLSILSPSLVPHTKYPKSDHKPSSNDVIRTYLKNATASSSVSHTSSSFFLSKILV